MLICTLSTLYLAGQEDFTPYFSIGVHGGITQSNVDFEPDIKQLGLMGSTAGISINYTAERHVGTQIEFNYAEWGWKDQQDTIGTYSRTMEFYEIPLLTHIYFTIKFVRINFDLGPYVALYKGYSESLPTNPLPALDSAVLGYRDYYGKDIAQNYDYGFVGGGGIGFFTKFGEFQINLRYRQGLTNIFKQYPKSNFRYSYMNGMTYRIGWVYPIYLSRKKKKDLP